MAPAAVTTAKAAATSPGPVLTNAVGAAGVAGGVLGGVLGGVTGGLGGLGGIGGVGILTFTFMVTYPEYWKHPRISPR